MHTDKDQRLSASHLRLRAVQAISVLINDERGQGETVSFTLAQLPFWVLVAILVAVTMLGLRRASAVLAVHEAGLASGRGPSTSSGQATAEHILDVWWGGDTAPVVFTESEQYRSVQVLLDSDWDTAAGRVPAIGPLSIEASSWGRKEGFYAGPPEPGGFE